MKLDRTFATIFLVVIMALSCNYEAPRTTELTPELINAITDTAKFFAHEVERTAIERDIDVSFNLFCDEPEFTFSEDGYILPSNETLYETMKGAYDNFSDIYLKYDTMVVSVLSPNSAVITAEGPWSATIRDGNKLGGHLVSMFVIGKRENEWKIIHGHTSHTYD